MSLTKATRIKQKGSKVKQDLEHPSIMGVFRADLTCHT